MTGSFGSCIRMSRSGSKTMPRLSHSGSMAGKLRPMSRLLTQSSASHNKDSGKCNMALAMHGTKRQVAS